MGTLFVKWPVEKWRNVRFSDESTFTIDNRADNNFVRRSEEERRPYYISPTVKHSQSIMVWCCTAAYGIGSLELVSGMINDTKYINMIKKRMLFSACSLFPNDKWIF